MDPVAWRPDVLARRIISWLSQATLLLDDSDVRFYRRFIRSLTRHVRQLRRTAADAPDGVPRLQAMIALTYAGLCMAGQVRHSKAATKRLADELARQILPDGGHISRNPGALIELLVDLLPLRQLFTSRNLVPPDALLNAIDRMMPMLRFFRHGDGSFALFNGMGPTPTDLLTTILAYDDARGTPVANAPHSGYQRVDASGTVVLMDTGVPPPLGVSTEAHAGCLSFELSTRQNRIVVNCGLPSTSRDSWRQVARSTAAHSTVTFNDESSCRFVESGPIKRMLNGAPIISGPRRVTAERGSQEGAIVLRTSHDGYAASFDIIHQRSLMLAADGRRLDGEDLFTPALGSTIAAGRDQFAIRFPPAPFGQGQSTVRHPRRHADDGQQGGLDVHRLRGPDRSRGERLSGRQRRPAPGRAAGDPWPGLQRDAGAVDIRLVHPVGHRAAPRARRGAAIAAVRDVDDQRCD